MSNNFFAWHTSFIYMYCTTVFCYICYGLAPRLFLRSTMIPIPKGGRSSSSNSDHFGSIAISSILSKILDYIIIDQQAHSLITSDYQSGFKPNLSTVLCTTMLVETVQYIMMKTVDNLYMFYNLMHPRPLIESTIVDYSMYTKMFVLTS